MPLSPETDDLYAADHRFLWPASEQRRSDTLTIPSTGEKHLAVAFTTLSYFSPQPNLCGRCTTGGLEGDVIGKSICIQQLGHNITFFLQSDIFATDTFYQNVPTPLNVKSSDFQRPHSD